MAINPSEWEWFGRAGHFIGGHSCHFHLCTKVGDYLVSTVGEYKPAHSSDNANWEDIGNNRKYETMVFDAGHTRCDSPDCNCGIPRPDNLGELDMLPANTAGDASRNHMTLCKRYAEMDEEPDNEKGSSDG